VKLKLLTIMTSAFFSMVVVSQSAIADGDFPRDEYLMGINWVNAPQDATHQAPRVNFSVPSGFTGSKTMKNEGLVSSRDEYLMGINWKEETNNTNNTISRVNFSVEQDDVTVDLDMIFLDPEH